METLRGILDGKDGTLHVVAPHASVLEAVERMCRARIGALLVMDGNVLEGIFSERDVMTRVVLAQRDPARTEVLEVMTRDVVSVGPHASAHEAMQIMTERRLRHLPVVDGARIVGIVSIGDVVRWTIRDREHEIEQMHEYISGRYPG